jgi:hypothetical protein
MTGSTILTEIVDGYSEIEVQGRTLFFKHPSLADRFRLSKIEKKLKKRAEIAGLKTRKEILEDAKTKGVWTDLDEDSLESLDWLIKSRKKAKDSLSDPSERNNLEELIKRDEGELQSLFKKRERICDASLEDFVAVKTPLFLCQTEIFEDETFKTPIDSDTAKASINSYLDKWTELSNRENLLREVYSPMFFDLMFIYGNLDSIFNKNVYEFTFFQKELLGYARILHSKLTRISNIPDGVRKDPLKLYLYEEKMTEKEVETNLRKTVESKGGLKNMRPEDKIT